MKTLLLDKYTKYFLYSKCLQSGETTRWLDSITIATSLSNRTANGSSFHLERLWPFDSEWARQHIQLASGTKRLCSLTSFRFRQVLPRPDTVESEQGKRSLWRKTSVSAGVVSDSASFSSTKAVLLLCVAWPCEFSFVSTAWQVYLRPICRLFTAIGERCRKHVKHQRWKSDFFQPALEKERAVTDVFLSKLMKSTKTNDSSTKVKIKFNQSCLKINLHGAVVPANFLIYTGTFYSAFFIFNLFFFSVFHTHTTTHN